MPYITSVERFGMIRGAREMLLKVIEARFQKIPEDLTSKVENIRVKETLESLVQEAATCQSIDALRKAMSEAHGS